LSLYILSALFASAQAAGLYRWVDESGKVHYGDVPAPEIKQTEKKKFSGGAAAPGADLPYESRRAMQNFPVTLYVADNCAEPCQKARDFLNKRGIPFSEKSLSDPKEMDAFRKASGSDQTPTLSVGTTWLSGFQADNWNSELDVAGYPKVAPYRAPAAPAPQPKPAPAIK
jgi:glutaredoxin